MFFLSASATPAFGNEGAFCFSRSIPGVLQNLLNFAWHEAAMPLFGGPTCDLGKVCMGEARTLSLFASAVFACKLSMCSRLGLKTADVMLRDRWQGSQCSMCRIKKAGAA